MEQPLASTRLAAPANKGDYSSPQQREQKRKALGIIKATGNEGAINDSSESGYSADRESVSTAHPIFVSVNLRSSYAASSSRYDSKCPKRQKKNEMQYAATTIKEDLNRAGIPYKQIDTENSKTFDAIENANINLKDHVRLVHSGTVLSETLLNTLTLKNTTDQPDYLEMINAARSFYPAVDDRMISLKSSTVVRSKDTWSAPSTSSDVSDTESDSGSGSENDTTNTNTNGQNRVISVSPLLEDSLMSQIRTGNKGGTQAKITAADVAAAVTTQAAMKQMTSSLSSNTITMDEILQLSKTARYDMVTLFSYSFFFSRSLSLSSCQDDILFTNLLIQYRYQFDPLFSLNYRIVISSSVPFSILHANAAFYRLLGNRAMDAVIGTSLLSLLDPKCNQFEDEPSPAKCMLSASASASTDATTTGDKKKLYILPAKQDNGKNDHLQHDDDKPIECFIRMSPIVSQNDEVQEKEPATNTDFFAIEFITGQSNELKNNVKLPSLFSNNANTPMEVVA